MVLGNYQYTTLCFYVATYGLFYCCVLKEGLINWRFHDGEIK